ncbi:MAG TPA: DNA adenine methylase [Capsulimonadaceae bacterium]|nr:DNA adenine methylase [Capsulimonadaceae bacterium]
MSSLTPPLPAPSGGAARSAGVGLSSFHDPRRHAYIRTTDYLFAQLIPYIGSKRKLLPLIARAIERTGVREGTFADLFAGSGVVSRFAKMRGFRVIANDWEPYAAAINGATIALNQPPCPDSLFEELNSLAPVEGYITRHYCPTDDHAPDPSKERLFYTRANGMRIDALRQWIADKEQAGDMTLPQKDYLLAPLLCAACYVANTSGVFKAYHHGWGGRTGTALYRILSDLRLSPPALFDNGQENIVTRCDAHAWAEGWSASGLGQCDICYLDPPYNQHPYGSNYHLLNTIALWDCPPVPPITEAKVAIRTDWRTQRRSAYNHSEEAFRALARLLPVLPSRWVLMSYSTDGTIRLGSLLEAFSEHGAISVEAHRYKRYRVSTPRMSARSHNVEFVLILDRDGKRRPADIGDCHEKIVAESAPA